MERYPIALIRLCGMWYVFFFVSREIKSKGDSSWIFKDGVDCKDKSVIVHRGHRVVKDHRSHRVIPSGEGSLGQS